MIPAGGTLRATVEHPAPPSDQGARCGESDDLTAMASEDFQGAAMMLALAQGSPLAAAASTGELSRPRPVEIGSAVGELAAESSLSGGLGYTPIPLHGLARHDGWRLERMDEGERRRIDQPVEGNDDWQAFHDAGSGTWDLIFDVEDPNGGADYRRIRAEDPRRQVRRAAALTARRPAARPPPGGRSRCPSPSSCPPTSGWRPR